MALLGVWWRRRDPEDAGVALIDAPSQRRRRRARKHRINQSPRGKNNAAAATSPAGEPLLTSRPMLLLRSIQCLIAGVIDTNGNVVAPSAAQL